MRRRPLFSILVPTVMMLAVVTTAGRAAAQDVAEVVASVDSRGYYIEPGADADINRIEAMTSQSVADRRPTAVVLLATEPTTIIEDDLAAMVVEQVDGVSAAVVLWGPAPGQRGLGAAGLDGVYGDAEIDAAADAAVTASVEGSSLADLAAAFIGSLPMIDAAADTGDATVDTGATQVSTDDDSGGGFPWIILLVPAIGVAVWLFFRSRRRKTLGGPADPADIETARAEIRDQLGVVANEILENENTVGLSDNPEAIEHYRLAAETYNDVLARLDTTTSLLELAELNDRVDHARWQMDAAEALVEGRPVPPVPAPEKPAACFFDPTHRPGNVEATVTTPAGSKQVSVCPSCARKLERGERPDPRMIDVAGRRVPAAKAPKSHGGAGMGGLDIFDIVLGGLGGILGGALGGGSSGDGGGGRGSGASRDPVSIDWGSPLGNQRRTKTSSGVFGPDRLPPRTPSRSARVSVPRRTGGRSRRRM